MSQDKSREFLHSGNDKDKFRIFFKATLLQQVDELLQSIIKQLKDAYALVDKLENLIRSIQLELSELQEKIENIKRVEQISKEVQLLKKKLAWSWVYDVNGQLQKQRENIEKLKDRIPTCQAKIDSTLDKLKLQELFSKKKFKLHLWWKKHLKSGEGKMNCGMLFACKGGRNLSVSSRKEQHIS